jgi:hypothetical protein
VIYECLNGLDLEQMEAIALFVGGNLLLTGEDDINSDRATCMSVLESN